MGNMQPFQPIDGAVYTIKSLSSNKYLDGRDPTSQPNDLLLTSRDPKDDAYLNWMIQRAGTGYSIKSISSDKYLDGGDPGNKQPLMTNRPPFNDKYLQWNFFLVDNEVAIQSISGRRFMDGRNKESNPYLKDSQPQFDKYLRWELIPSYKLKAAIYDFDFGNEMEYLLDRSKTISFKNTDIITADVVGITSEGSYGEKVVNTFSYGFSETVGIGISTEVTAGVPGCGQSKTTYSFSFEFCRNQQRTEQSETNWSKNWKFTPKEVGKFEVGMIVYSVKNVELPFTATVKMTAFAEDGNNTQYPAKLVEQFAKLKGFNCQITKCNGNIIEAIIHGKLTANFSVSSREYVKKIE